MGFRPRIAFARTAYLSGLDAPGALVAGDCVCTKFSLNMVGESPWVINHDVVLKQVDIIEAASSAVFKKNYKLFLCASDYTAAAAGSPFTSGLTAVESSLKLLKGYIDCSTAYVDVSAAPLITAQYNKSIEHYFDFNLEDSSTLFGQLILVGTGVTFGSDSRILIKCHFELQ